MLNVTEKTPAPRDFGNERYLHEYRIFLATLSYVFSNASQSNDNCQIFVLGGGNCEETVALRNVFPHSEIHVFELHPTPLSTQNIALSGAKLWREDIFETHIGIDSNDIVVARNAPISQDTAHKPGINHTTLKVNPSKWVGLLREIINTVSQKNAKILTTYGSLAEGGFMASKLKNSDQFEYEKNPFARLTTLQNDQIGRDGYLLYSKRKI